MRRNRAMAALAISTAVVAAAATTNPTPSHAALPKQAWVSVDVEIDGNDQPSVQVADWHGMTWEGDPIDVQAQRLAEGSYRFTIPGVRASNGVAMVTTINKPGDPGNDPICTASSITVGSSSTKINVRCFDPVTGTSAPGRHLQLNFDNFVRSSNPLGPAELIRLRTSSSTSSHTPTARFRSDRRIGVPTKMKVKKLGTGRYRVIIGGAQWGVFDGVVNTTAISTSPRWCNPVTWNPTGASGTDLSIEVHCFKPGSILANSKFALVGARLPYGEWPGYPAAAQMAILGGGNGPAPQAVYGFNTQGNVNVAYFNSGKQVTVVQFPGMLVPDVQRAIFVNGVGAHRCALSYELVASVDRYVATRCIDPAGNPVNQTVVVSDTSNLYV